MVESEAKQVAVETQEQDWKRVRQNVVAGEFEVFHDALLSARFEPPGGGKASRVVFQYDLLDKENDGIVGAVKRNYDVSVPEEMADLAIDIRRVGFELPTDYSDIPHAIDEIDFAGLLVEVQVRGSSWIEEPDVLLVKRYPCSNN